MKKLLLFLGILFWSTSGFCAYTTNSTTNPLVPDVQFQNFVQGTDTAGTYKVVFTPGANSASGSVGGRLYAIYESNNDTSTTHLVSCEEVVSGVSYVFTATTTAVNDGTANGVPAKNFIISGNLPNLKMETNGNTYLDFSSDGQVVKCTYATALTSTDLINLIAVGADY